MSEVDNVDNAMSALEMSDEQISDMDLSLFDEPESELEPEAESSDDEANQDEDEGDYEEQDEDETSEDADDFFDKDDEEDAVEDAEGESLDLDYESEYKKLLAPFKANGKQMQAENVDEVRQLMQMGANYNKKMAALKPNLQMLKILEKNDLLDEGKLSFLIDLDKKNPEAIKKLVKDSELDLFDLDTETDSDYRPNDYSIDEVETQLDDVLTGLRETPHYSQVINLVTKEWDSPSKQIVANNPQLLNVLSDQMANGTYEMVSNAVERERMFGRLQGLSDIEAYRQVGDQLEAKGAFNSLAGATKPGKRGTPRTNTNAADPNLTSKKRAASSSKSSKKAPEAPRPSALSLSDEDFEKDFMTKFI